MLFKDHNRQTYQTVTLVAGVFLLSACAFTAHQADPAATPSAVDYVDPFIGTDGKGKTYPGATVPYGMVQLSPDNGRNGWDWISGYFYPDQVIAGFSHTHLSGTGAGDLYDISFMPITQPYHFEQLDDVNPDPTLVSRFSHDQEEASPGYYQVFLQDYQVKVELTAAQRSGVQRYHYQTEQGKVKLDLGYARNWDATVATELEIVDNRTIRGLRRSTGWAKDQRTYFYTRFSQPFVSLAAVVDGEDSTQSLMTGKDIEVIFTFDTSTQKSLTLATAISSVSTQNAEQNLIADLNGSNLITSTTFDQIHAQARQAWQTELSKVEVIASEDNLTQFYTALYHSALAPRVFSDANGEYTGPDGNVHRASSTPRYEFFSLWDTFRAQHPWKTITHPSRSAAMMRSIEAHYDEYGLLPVWSFQGNETDMMMGYHAVPVLADAWLKGLVEIDGDKLLNMMTKSAEQQAQGIGAYNHYGYVPFEDISWNVSRTLEYAFDDWAIAKVAEKLGAQDIAQTYFQRALRYQHHFDPQQGLMRAKSRDGHFKPHFDPLAYHPEDYCEANAWQYSFFVPHDVEGLMALYPSKADFVAKLEEMFATEQAGDDLPEWISGYIGQYVHGNEPAHHVPYLFRLAGQAHKGEAILRRVMDELYSTQPDGLCGNEDAGQMSAWYLFSAVGFYPVNPVGGEYVLGSPEVEQAVFHLENGKQFKVTVDNQSPTHVYVKSIWLNGVRLTGNTLKHEDLIAGGELRFEMSDQPAQGQEQ